MRPATSATCRARDKGPVKKFIRNFVDSRRRSGSSCSRVLVMIMAMQSPANARAHPARQRAVDHAILVVAVDSVWMLFRVKQALRAEVPRRDPARASRLYALHAACSSCGSLRLPKPQVKIGGSPALIGGLAQPASSDIGP